MPSRLCRSSKSVDAFVLWYLEINHFLMHPYADLSRDPSSWSLRSTRATRKTSHNVVDPTPSSTVVFVILSVVVTLQFLRRGIVLCIAVHVACFPFSTVDAAIGMTTVVTFCIFAHIRR